MRSFLADLWTAVIKRIIYKSSLPPMVCGGYKTRCAATKNPFASRQSVAKVYVNCVFNKSVSVTLKWFCLG